MKTSMLPVLLLAGMSVATVSPAFAREAVYWGPHRYGAAHWGPGWHGGHYWGAGWH
jgi:hypothetical protein